MYKDYEIKLNAILDKHRTPKKFNFKDIKTLEKLTGQLKSLISKLDDSKIKSEISNYNKVNDAYKQTIQDLDKADESLKSKEKQLEDLKKEITKFEKAYNTADKKNDSALKKRETAANKVFNANDKYIANYQKGDDIATKLTDAIFDVEEGAKKLGLSINVSQYEAAINNFYNNEADPLSKLDFDY